MKSVKQVVVLLAAAAAISIFSGCKSTPPAEEPPKQTTVVLDHKGAAIGAPIPEWFMASINGNKAVEALSQYKDVNCFVVENNDPNRDYAVAWVNNASGPAAIAAVVSTTVVAAARNNLEGENGSDIESSLSATQEALSNTSFSNSRREADWWMIVQNEATGVTECRAAALYTIDKKALANQIASSVQNMVDQRAAMSAAERAIYASLIENILQNGYVQ